MTRYYERRLMVAAIQIAFMLIGVAVAVIAIGWYDEGSHLVQLQLEDLRQ